MDVVGEVQGVRVVWGEPCKKMYDKVIEGAGI